MSDTVKVAELPGCDLCKAFTPDRVLPAAYDGATVMGPWAYMCEEHYASSGRGLGTGVGQRLIVDGAP